MLKICWHLLPLHSVPHLVFSICANSKAADPFQLVARGAASSYCLCKLCERGKTSLFVPLQVGSMLWSYQIAGWIGERRWDPSMKLGWNLWLEVFTNALRLQSRVLNQFTQQNPSRILNRKSPCGAQVMLEWQIIECWKSIIMGLPYLIFFPGYPLSVAVGEKILNQLHYVQQGVYTSLYKAWLFCTSSRHLNNMYKARRSPALQLNPLFIRLWNYIRSLLLPWAQSKLILFSTNWKNLKEEDGVQNHGT